MTNRWVEETLIFGKAEECRGYSAWKGTRNYFQISRCLRELQHSGIHLNVIDVALRGRCVCVQAESMVLHAFHSFH